MAEKGFGVKEIDFIGSSPKITSPSNLNLNAVNVAISTNVSIGGTLSVTGSVSIGGTLTYEDVTNIDSVGIITAREGIKIPDDKKLQIGNNQDIEIYHSSNESFIRNKHEGNYFNFQSGAGVSGGFIFKNEDDDETFAIIKKLGVELYCNDNLKFQTTNTGAVVTGIMTATSFSGDGSQLTGISGGGGSGFFSQTTAGIHTLSKVGIGTTNPKFDLDLGSYVSQNVSIASTLRIVGNADSTAIRIGPGGASRDITVLRVDSRDGTTDGDNNTDLGHSIKYMGSGSGAENRLAFWVDNTSKSKYEALSIYNDGFVSINYNLGFNGVSPGDHFTVEGSSKFNTVRVVGVSTFQNVLPQTDSTYDIGSNSVRFANIYADTLYGSGANLTSLPSPDPSNSDIQGMWTVGGSASGYTFTGPGQDGSEQNPDIFLVRGQRYRFVNSLAGGHPFEFRNFDNNADYTDGITGSQSGTQDFNVQHDAPSALKYRCTIHTTSMLGNIYIIGGKRGILTQNTTLTGSSLTFDGIPSWVTKITVNLLEASLSGSNQIYVRLRAGSSSITSGYNSVSGNFQGNVSSNKTDAFNINTTGTSQITSGSMVIEKVDSAGLKHIQSNTFQANNNSRHGAGVLNRSSGDAIDGIELLTEHSDTFDDGVVTIYYE